VPTALELAADPADLLIIRDLYGSRAQTLINALLGFDGYFNWYYPLKESIPFMCSMALREERALDNMRKAVDMQEIFERVSIRKHGSFLPHGAVFKVTRDILMVGDVWAVDTSKLEMQNAATKRTATSSGSKRLTTSTSGEQLRPMRGTSEGPAQLVSTAGYSTSLALSTLRHLLGASYLRRGDGIRTMPDSRRNERLFGAEGTGRVTLINFKRELTSAGWHKPRHDTCIRAFVRMLAERAASAAVEDMGPSV
jgi:hypothetical protein